MDGFEKFFDCKKITVGSEQCVRSQVIIQAHGGLFFSLQYVTAHAAQNGQNGFISA